MLQSMRSGAQSTPVKILLILIVISFAGFGVESVLFGSSGTSVADVNGEEITPQQLQIAIENQKRQMMQIFGENLDPAMLEDDRLRGSALEGLIERQLLLQSADAQGLVASSRAIGQIVASVEAFQVDGQFDADRYKVVLANAGLSPERFRREQAQQIKLSDLQQSVLASDFTTALEVAATADISSEERDVRYLLLDAEAVFADVVVSEDAVAEYYGDHLDDFVSEEQVVAQYIELQLEDFFAPVDEALVREQFEAVKGEYEVKDQTRVAHILLIQGDDESIEEYTQRIDDVAARLAAGTAFGDVAANASDDIGSADLGGELGFTDGTVFPDAMEEAIAELEVGQISAPVKTDAGTHFIRVEERVAGEAPDFESLRAELADSIQRSAAEKELLIAVDALRDISFNSPDLTGPAESLGVQSQLSSPVTRGAGDGVFGNEQVRAALFSNEVYQAGNNSEVIELPGSRFVAVRVAEKVPPAQLVLEEVATDIRAQLEMEARAAELDRLLEEIKARRQAGETIDAIATESGWEWRVELGARRVGSLLPREVANAAFRMELEGGFALDMVELPGEQYAVVELARVTPGSVDNLSNQERDAIVSQLAQMQGELSLLAYRRALRDNAEIVTR